MKDRDRNHKIAWNGSNLLERNFRRAHRVGILLATLSFCSLFVFGFQNCTNKNIGLTKSESPIRSAGNGDGYAGKISVFGSYDESNPCSDLDQQGAPLSNSALMIEKTNSSESVNATIVRDNCKDIPPITVDPKNILVSGDNSTQISFEGRTYRSVDVSKNLDIIAPVCPQGKVKTANAERRNLLISPWDLRDQTTENSWFWHDGIEAILDGTMLTLPIYKVRRNDGQFLEEWRRVFQRISLQANKQYVFSFLAKSGNVTSATFRYYRPGINSNMNEFITVDFDFQTNQATVRQNLNVPTAVVNMQPVPNGYLCSIYFFTSQFGNLEMSDLGVSPTARNSATGQVGDFVYAGGVQLEEVDKFCQ